MKSDSANAAEIMSFSDHLKMYILGNKVKNINENKNVMISCLKDFWLSSDQT